MTEPRSPQQRHGPRPWVRAAAHYHMEHIAATQAEIAAQVNKSLRQFQRVVQAGEYAEAFVLEMRLDTPRLHAAARAGLIKAWSKGNGAETARKILVGAKILDPERIELAGAGGGPIELTSPELNARIEALLNHRPPQEENP